jgi:hypothetical protein
MTEREYTATSPLIDAFYYQDIALYFQRWLNIEGLDTANIDVSNNDGGSWIQVWQNGGSIISDEWTRQKIDLKNSINRDDSVRVRFTLGPSDGSFAYSGWNIDNFILIGDYISQDVGIVDWIYPVDGCGHTSEDSVQVIIENFGGDPTVDTIPLSYSFDGGTTITRDTIYGSIPVGGTKVFTFSKTVDLTQAGWYRNVWAKTNLPEDEANENDQYDLELFISPTYNPPYNEDFEDNYGFWLENRDSSIWDHDIPTADVIDTAASGSFIWGTNTAGLYRINDSSYLESPCFNFADMRKPIFEFNFWSELEQGRDGLALYYSIDNGESWDLVPTNGDYDWNWYTSDTIDAFNSGPGWDTTTTGYINAKQILPEITGGQSNVKFSLVFATDPFNRFEGVAIDDIKIYEAPPDVAVTKIEYPVSQCYLSDTVHTQVYVKNTGIDTLFAGQQIPMRLKVDNNSLIKDTLELTNYLIPNDSVLFTFNETVDMNDSGDFVFQVYSVLEEDPYFYDSINNDTISDTITVKGMPNYDIGYIIGMPAPVDTTLDAGGGFSSYQWASGEGNLATTQTYNVADTTGWFYVTVTNAEGCNASDSVKVVDSETNVGITQMLTTFSDSCERNVAVSPQVEISNTGLIDLQVGDTIPVAYQINELDPVIDTIFLGSILTKNAPDSTLIYTFPQSIDLSAVGQYNIKFYTNILEDYNHLNDTIPVTVNTWGYPDTELRHDTLLTAKADSITLDAGAGFDTYNWQDGSSTQTFDITHNRSQWYKVTVTDVHGCGSDADSTLIISSDIGIEELVAPVSDCEFTTTEPVSIRIKNFGADTLQSGKSIDVTVIHDETNLYNDVVTLSSNLEPDSTVVLTLPSTTIDISSVGEHPFIVYHSETFEVNRDNDTLRTTVETWGYPDMEIFRDTIYTLQADTVQLFAGSGFGTYTWKADDSNDTISTNDTLFVSDKYSRQYHATVTDVHGCGSDSDSVQVFTYNLGVQEMVAPSSDCELTASEDIQISIKNYSKDTLLAGDTLDVVMVYGTDTTRDFKTLTSQVLPGGTFTHTFSQSIDMSAFQTYYFTFFTDHPFEAGRSNDTILDAVRTYGYPEFSLNIDSLYTTQADTVVLYPDIVENSYLWQNESNSDTFHVSNLATATYSLTVTDINGCSFSDTSEIITYNLGVDSIIAPYSDCELTSTENLTVQVRNYGSDTLQPGMNIPVKYTYNGGSVVNETLTLSSTVYPDSAASHTFTPTFDMSTPGNYTFKAWTDYVDEAYPANDTISRTIENYGYPAISLSPDTIFTTQADTVVLEPGSGYADYLWQDGSTGSTYSITDNFSKEYFVTVTNADGCSSYDSIQIITYNLGINELVSPLSNCENTSGEQVTVAVENASLDTLYTGDSLTVSFTMDTYQETDQVILQTDLWPGDTLHHHFDTQVDMTSETTYDFVSNVSYRLDVDATNDSQNTTLESYGYPNIDLGPDTLFTSRPDTVTLEPGAGYADYLWQDATTTATYDVTSMASAMYKVTVTSQYGCSSEDSIQIISTDISSYAIASPVSDCQLTNSENVTVRIVNTSQDLISSGTVIPMVLTYNGTDTYLDTLTLTSSLGANDTVNFTFDQDFDLTQPGSYQFSVEANLKNDVISANNTTSKTVEIFGFPEPDLGDDVTVEALSYTIDAGNYASYEWHNGSTSREFEVNESTQTLDNNYAVTVTDANGCPGSDKIKVVLNIKDISISELVSPADQCLSSDSTPVTIRLVNRGNVAIEAGTGIPVFFRIDGVISSDETYNVPNTISPGSVVNYSFNKKAAFDEADDYSITANLSLSGDLKAENNEITGEFEIYAAPNVNLGPDTLTTELPYTLNAGNHASYEWQDGSSARTFEVTSAGTYSVTVTSASGCSASDQIVIEEEEDDEVGILSIEDSKFIKVFPNPAEDKVFLQIALDRTREATMKLIDTRGGMVLENRTFNTDETLEIQTNQYARGVYYLVVEIDKQRYQKKIILH